MIVETDDLLSDSITTVFNMSVRLHRSQIVLADGLSVQVDASFHQVARGLVLPFTIVVTIIFLRVRLHPLPTSFTFPSPMSLISHPLPRPLPTSLPSPIPLGCTPVESMLTTSSNGRLIFP